MWSNADMSMFFFFTEKEEPVYIPHVELSSLVWGNEASRELGTVTATLRGMLPHGLKLFRMSSGTKIVIVHSPCGRPGYFESTEAVMSLHVLEVSTRTILELVITDPLKAARATVEVKVVCEVKDENKVEYSKAEG